jgi:5-(carboxyamino)imidazole ribonucleotide synthase
MTSQFEQQLRAVCALPLGSTEQFQPAAMANLLGDLWIGGEPDWAAAIGEPSVKLHLYGKLAPRAGRKMGHITALGNSAEEACDAAVRARGSLTRHSTTVGARES